MSLPVNLGAGRGGRRRIPHVLKPLVEKRPLVVTAPTAAQLAATRRRHHAA